MILQLLLKKFDEKIRDVLRRVNRYLAEFPSPVAIRSNYTIKIGVLLSGVLINIPNDVHAVSEQDEQVNRAASCQSSQCAKVGMKAGWINKRKNKRPIGYFFNDLVDLLIRVSLKYRPVLVRGKL